MTLIGESYGCRYELYMNTKINVRTMPPNAKYNPFRKTPILSNIRVPGAGDSDGRVIIVLIVFYKNTKINVSTIPPNAKYNPSVLGIKLKSVVKHQSPGGR